MSLRSLLGGAVDLAPRARQARRLRNDAPVPYVGKYRAAMGSLGAFGGKGDATEELGQYGEISTLFGVVSTLATATSLVNWRLWRKAPSGKDEDRVEVTSARESAPLAVWNKPNPFMTRNEYVETFQQHVDLTGEAWWVVYRFLGVPVELWPVRPDRMAPVKSVKEFIKGYVYTSPDGEQVPLNRDDVIMIRWPSPLDIYRGQGPLPALRGDLGNEEAQRAWSEAFYQNAAIPGGIIETGGVILGEAEFEELADRWRRQHQGVNNAGRVAILEQGKFVPMSYTQRDMQFVESRGLTKQAILDAYAMPKFGIGDVDDVNRASAEASRAYLAESKTVPRLERIKGALNNDFLAMFGQEQTHEFDYDNPVPEDRETENDTLETKVRAVCLLTDAGFAVNDACATVGLPLMAWDAANRSGKTDVQNSAKG